ncbi:MAG TPA: ABC transporter permease subunit [Acholeplasmataceae bacterium]|nr:ABC transporter permease subunit [Acholeplasmataceae bacterium]
MKFMSYLKAILSGLVWGLGQLFNKQFIKALFFFIFFVAFIGIELGTSNYFYEETEEYEIAYNKIPGESINDILTDFPSFYGVRVGTYSSERDLNFEAYLEEIGVVTENNIPINGTEKYFTEAKAIEYFAREYKKSSPEIFINIKTKETIPYEDFNLDSFYNIKTREVLYYSENNDKFYAEYTYENEDGEQFRDYIETNFFTNNKIENPEVLNSNEGLQRVSKQVTTDSNKVQTGLFIDNSGNLYLNVNYQTFDEEGKSQSNIKTLLINTDNEIIESGTTVLTPITIFGPIYMNGTDKYEHYRPAMNHNGVRIQYNDIPIMKSFKAFMRDRMDGAFGRQIESADYERLMLMLTFELNPEIREDFTNHYNNFFFDRAGMFVKGVWSVATLGIAHKQDYSSYMALYDSMVGMRNSSGNINDLVNLTESIPIMGHVSVMLLLEGLIGLILAFFFIIFMIWSIIDAYRISEQKRLDKEIANEKEYFKGVWDNGFEYIVLSPAIFVLAFISIMPILFGFILAFTSISGESSMNANFEYVGLANFFALFNFSSGLGASFGRAFWSVLGWTFIWAILSTATVFFGGFIQALILNSEKVVFRKLWRTILILPWAIPALLSQMVFSVMFKDYGFVNQLLQNIGVYDILMKIGVLGKPFSEMSGILKYFWMGESNILWFSNSFNPNFVKATLIVVNIWLGFPYFMALMTGIMTAIDKTLYEAADIDGATGFQKIIKITVPMVLYSTAPILIMTFSGNFNNFGVIYFITGGGPNAGLASRGYAGSTDILISWMYSLTVDHSIYNMASVFSVLIFIAVGSVTAWNLSRTRAFQED